MRFWKQALISNSQGQKLQAPTNICPITHPPPPPLNTSPQNVAPSYPATLSTQPPPSEGTNTRPSQEQLPSAVPFSRGKPQCVAFERTESDSQCNFKTLLGEAGYVSGINSFVQCGDGPPPPPSPPSSPPPPPPPPPLIGVTKQKRGEEEQRELVWG